MSATGICCLAFTGLLLSGCVKGDPDADLGPIEETLSFSDRVNWPGVDRGDERAVMLTNGFGEGVPGVYWFFGLAPLDTVDSFWFCREGDSECPVDANRRLNWDSIVGHPLLPRVPGQSGYSPYWQMWKVTVPADFEPDFVKTEATLDRLEAEGTVSREPLIIDFDVIYGAYWGPLPVVVHVPLVLAGTTLDGEGGMMPDGTGPMLNLERRHGWHEGFQVEFIDFTRSDGVFPESDQSVTRPLMRFAKIYILFRTCGTMPVPAICDIPGYAHADRRPISERGLGEDITGDGDFNDTNNVMGSLPCSPRTGEKPYSPLWKIYQVFVNPTATVGLVDTSGDQEVSDIMSAADILSYAMAGDITDPEAMTEDVTGYPIPGKGGELFFNCPNPVPEDFVPYPCE